MAKKPVLKVITNPKLDKPANGNSPKPKSVKPSPITFDEKPGRFTKAGQSGPKAPPQKAATTKPIKTNAPQDARKIWDSQARKGAKPKPSSVTFGEKPQGASNRFTSKLGQKAAKPAAKAASTAASTVGRSLGVGVKVGIKALGAVALPLDMIASAKPAGLGSDKPEGPLMKGNSSVGGGRRKAAGTPFAEAAKSPKMQGSMTAVPNKGPGTSYPKPAKASSTPSLGYGTFNTPATMPKATGSESVGPKKTPSHGGGGFPSAAPAASTSSPGFSKGSTKAPAYVAPGPATKRGGVETRYNRDSGLAMDSRKRK